MGGGSKSTLQTPECNAEELKSFESFCSADNVIETAKKNGKEVNNPMSSSISLTQSMGINCKSEEQMLARKNAYLKYVEENARAMVLKAYIKHLGKKNMAQNSNLFNSSFYRSLRKSKNLFWDNVSTFMRNWSAKHQGQ